MHLLAIVAIYWDPGRSQNVKLDEFSGMICPVDLACWDGWLNHQWIVYESFSQVLLDQYALCAPVFLGWHHHHVFFVLIPTLHGPKPWMGLLFNSCWWFISQIAEALKSGWTVEARAFSSWIRIMKSIGIPVCCRVRWGTIEAILNEFDYQ